MSSQSFLVIMAGGSGTRFWPKSTSQRPKQLLEFGSSVSLINQTLERFDGIIPAENRIIITTEKLKTAITEDAPDSVEVLAEPAGRNTAPCNYWAARHIFEKNPKAIIFMMPADHYIDDVSALQKSVQLAGEWAASHDDLVTLGVQPNRPETGYGYLRKGKEISCLGFAVDQFVEKPDKKKAEEYLKSGQYLWNGGMFVWRADIILKAFDAHMPEMKKAWDAAKGDVAQAYPNMEATSIDYGIMERAKNVVTVPIDCGWDDLGAWTSLESLGGKIGTKEDLGIVLGGSCIASDAKGNIVDAPGKVVALLGVNDLIVVQSGDTILVARKDRAQDIKLLVEKVKAIRPDLV